MNNSADTPEAADSPESAASGLSRRGLFGLIGVGAAGAALGVGGTLGVSAAASSATPSDAGTAYPFFGEHQAGIVTPAQDRLHFASYDMSSTANREDLIELLQDWSYAASRLTQGLDVSEEGAVDGPLQAPPDDTGEALGLNASALTITFGFGRTLFVDSDGVDRFGIKSKLPPLLEELPHFPNDSLEDALTGGDLCIQACSDDPQVAVHAIRNLSRIAFGRASIRWSQLGFGRTSSTTRAQVTPRNLFGFKDGTANVKAEDTTELAEQVWAAASDGSDWMTGGSYLVARKIRMLIELWDRTRLEEQNRVIGRDKGEGAPLTGGTEFTEAVFDANTVKGDPIIDRDAHMRLAHPDNNNGAKLLRRGYNFVEGNDELGRLNAGLFFISYQRNPGTQFVPMQRKLGETDLLNEYIKHVGSGLFAIPPGARAGSYVGAGIFS